jgi:uncharacterized MAPEG superfamily protein
MLSDVQALLFSALLALVMLLTASCLRAKIWTLDGGKFAFGNREGDPPNRAPVAGRADRAARNMLEGLTLFIAVMLADRVSGRGASEASLGATLFFWARVAYWPIYLAGITYLRTVAWIVSIAGLFLLALRALG